MKKLLLFFICYAPIVGFSQFLHSFIEADKTWDELFVTDISTEGKQYFIDAIYQANGYNYGTIKSYALINQTPNNFSVWPPIFVLDSTQVQVEMYLREDLSSGKLYGSSPLINETLLHDYSLGIGDSVFMDGTYHYVTNIITTTLHNNQSRYTIVFDSMYHLIDGIGGNSSLLSVIGISNSFSSYLLACVQKNNSSLYGSYCNTILSNKTYQVEQQIKLFPNPCHNLVQLKSDKQHQLIEIYTYNGQLVKAIDLDKNNPTIDISALKTGLYFYRIDRQYTGTLMRID
jgi:hypothetical protein